YECNNKVAYTLRGVHVALEILWNWEAVEGGDVYEASFRGDRSTIEIRQGKDENFVPQLYIVPLGNNEVADAVEKRVAALQSRWPGLSVVHAGEELRLVIPSQY